MLSKNLFKHIDFLTVGSALLLVLFGLLSIFPFSGGSSALFEKQLFSLFLAFSVFLVVANIDVRFLRNSKVITILFVVTTVILGALFVFGSVFSGARSWFAVGDLAFQPVDVAKVVLLLVLAKYFAKRHMQIADLSHIFISGAYTGILFLLVLLQPDFGSAMIIFFIWLGMVLISGLNWKHLLGLFLVGAAALLVLWSFVFADYQKNRVMTFFNPTADLQGTGYNANQAKIALGSGQLVGKGLGYGTQSRLSFLPEHETDFIFSSFGEEWGFVGLMLVFGLFGVIITRLAMIATRAGTNFESLFIGGVAIYFFAHFFVHVGINIGVLPVTGTTLPFMSYGGSHLLSEFVALGLVMSMSRHNRSTHKSDTRHEFLGAVKV